MGYTYETRPYTFIYVVQVSWLSADAQLYEVRNTLTDVIIYRTTDQCDAHTQADMLNDYRQDEY